jgi:hypothetical protein
MLPGELDITNIRFHFLLQNVICFTECFEEIEKEKFFRARGSDPLGQIVGSWIFSKNNQAITNRKKEIKWKEIASKISWCGVARLPREVKETLFGCH